MLIFEEQGKRLGVKVGDQLTIAAPTARGMNNTADVRVVAVLEGTAEVELVGDASRHHAELISKLATVVAGGGAGRGWWCGADPWAWSCPCPCESCGLCGLCGSCEWCA